MVIGCLCIYAVRLPVVELFKLPALMEHFEQHQLQNETLNFWDFLILHYAHSNSEEKEHQKLPFKSPSFFLFTDKYHLPTCVRIITDNLFEGVLLPEKREFYRFSNCSLFFCSIWQPPKRSV